MRRILALQVHLIVIFGFLPPLANAATMEEQVKGAHAVSALCKSYAERLGRDSSNYARLNVQTLRIAEELGYTDDFEEYQQQVVSLQKILDRKLLDQYGSVSEIYDDWCNRFYTGLKNTMDSN